MSGLEDHPIIYVLVAAIAGVCTVIAGIVKRQPKKDTSTATHDQFRIELDEIKERVAWIEGNLGKN